MEKLNITSNDSLAYFSGLLLAIALTIVLYHLIFNIFSGTMVTAKVERTLPGEIHRIEGECD